MPWLLAQLDRMRVAELLDRWFPTHGNWQGLSLGRVVSVWGTFILSEANPRLRHVEPWAATRQQSLNTSLGPAVEALDFSEDRLAAALEYWSEDGAWPEFERHLTQHPLRGYDLRPERVHLDATTAKSYGRVTAEGLVQFGPSKAHRPDLPQFKVNLSVLAPLGLPLTTTGVSGNRAADPRYVPEIKRGQASLGQRGLTSSGAATRAALTTRASVAASATSYRCPLPATQVPAEELERVLAPVWEQRQALTPVWRPAAREAPEAEPDRIAEGYAVTVAMEARLEGRRVQWQERRLVVRSVAWAQAQPHALATRLASAQADLAALTERRQGKQVYTEAAELQAAGEQILAKSQVRGVLQWHCQTHAHERPLRRDGARPARVQVDHHVQLTASVEAAALAHAPRRLGWRVYGSTHPAAQLALAPAVLAYRAEYRVERGFGRRKGQPLSLTPLYLESDARVTGLLRVRLIALRVLGLLEFSVRRQLHAKGEKRAGLYPGNPKRATARPTTDMRLRAFDGITLTLLEQAGQISVYLTPLSAVQQRILHLLGLSPEIYLRLAQHSSKPLLKMSEP